MGDRDLVAGWRTPDVGGRGPVAICGQCLPKSIEYHGSQRAPDLARQARRRESRRSSRWRAKSGAPNPASENAIAVPVGQDLWIPLGAATRGSRSAYSKPP